MIYSYKIITLNNNLFQNFKFISLIPTTEAFINFAKWRISIITGKRLLTFKWIKCIPQLLNLLKYWNKHTEITLVNLDCYLVRLIEWLQLRKGKLSWKSRGGFRGRRGWYTPHFTNHLLFCNYSQAGDVNVNLASLKSQVSPLKTFVKCKKLIRFHHQTFIICKNGRNLKTLIEIIHQELIVSNVILAFLNYLKAIIFFVRHPWWQT